MNKNKKNMKKERKQFNVQDFVSNEETPVETRTGEAVVIENTADKGIDSKPVTGRIVENGRCNWTSEGKLLLNSDHECDLFFRQKNIFDPLNLARVLKDVPPGTKLYSPIFGECELDEVRGDEIRVIDSNKYPHCFYEHGNFLKDEGECLLFPSRDNHDWRTFKVEKGFEVGDQQKKPNRTVKCSFCGREFIEPIPHRCNKNYRKRHLKWINLMEMEEERKQFNVEEFISNTETPVETRDGREVEIFTPTRENEDTFVVVGVIGEHKSKREEYSGYYTTWTKEGRFRSPTTESVVDLFFSAKKKKRRMTNQELSWWLQEHLEEHRECMHKDDRWISSNFKYNSDNAEEEVPVSILIRSNGGEWKEPLFDEVEK